MATRIGRPPLKASERRDHKVGISLTRAEARLLARIAKQLDVRPSEVAAEAVRKWIAREAKRGGKV